MSNKKVGNDFEREFCEILSENGFWVHNFAQNKDGQPADVIAVKDGEPFLIDCKVCDSGIFQLSRIEENQILAMQHWFDCRCYEAWFALKIDDNIIMIAYNQMMFVKVSQKTMTRQEMYAYGSKLEYWLNDY